MGDLPLLIMAITIWCYWLIAGGLAVRNRLVDRAPAGLIPREKREQIMWLIWVPVIALWIALPAIALRKDDPPWALPGFATSQDAVRIVRWAAAAIGVLALGATIRCWVAMGRSWRVAVVPGEKTQLITAGPFRFVRHPIYALSCLLIVCSAVVLPTAPMIVIAIVHLVLMNLKARNEERFMLSTHGKAYEQYMARTGRFLPRIGRP